jgi:hypothetical protein
MDTVDQHRHAGVLAQQAEGTSNLRFGILKEKDVQLPVAHNVGIGDGLNHNAFRVLECQLFPDHDACYAQWQ